MKKRCLVLPQNIKNNSEIHIPKYENLIFPKDVPIGFLYCLKYFGNKYGVRGSIFGHIFGRSKNVPKNIAIDQESLISHLGIN